MNKPEESVRQDLLNAQDTAGTELMYIERDGSLYAVLFDAEGDEVAQYRVRITLEEL